jgi:hypothetical protein
MCQVVVERDVPSLSGLFLCVAGSVVARYKRRVMSLRSFAGLISRMAASCGFARSVPRSWG